MFKLKLTAIPAAVAAFLVGLGSLAAPAVASANLAPNPGFEVSCGGPPCGWSTSLDASLVLDGGAAHGGSVGVDLVAKAGVLSGRQASSQCVPGTTGGTTYTYSLWYRTFAPVKWVSMSAAYYAHADCSSTLSNPGGAYTSSPINDGLWHELTGQAVAPAGAQSAFLSLEFVCPNVVSCAAGTTVTFDDVSFDAAGTTAATMRSFTASRAPAGTLVRWRTAAETELAGFNLYRVANGHKVKVNRRLIAAKGKGGGAGYRFLDRGHRGASYRLEVVDLDGTHQWRNAS
jgi:hypothetical protein